MQARRIFHLAHSSDLLVWAVAQDPCVVSKFKKVWLRAGGTEGRMPSLGGTASNAEGDATGPTTEMCPVPCDWRLEEFSKWTGLPTQGVGIAGFQGSRVSNAWLRKPRGFRERHYIAALQLRAGVYPTLEFRYRGRSRQLQPAESVHWSWNPALTSWGNAQPCRGLGLPGTINCAVSSGRRRRALDGTYTGNGRSWLSRGLCGVLTWCSFGALLPWSLT